MADIKLTVGIKLVDSYNEFKKGIGDITRRINKNPPKIKIDLDQNSLRSIQAQIHKLTAMPYNIEGVGSGIGGKLGNQGDSEATERSKIIKEDTKQYYDTLRKIDALDAKIEKRKKWTAANSGKTKTSFKLLPSLQSDLKYIREDVESGTAKTKDVAEDLAAVSSEAERVTTEIIKADKNTKSFGDKLAGVAKKFAYLLSTVTVMTQVVQLMKQMVATSMEIESSMAQIKIVTGASDYQMETFLTKSISLAKELGRSVTEVASSIETFARLGYNMADSSTLAKYVNIMSNVANTDVATATTGLTSIIKGYELSPEDAEHVSDVLVKVGQEYAISAEELMEAFQRGGAALHASGTDFEKSAALFAATNASLQNAETTGKHICPVA